MRLSSCVFAVAGQSVGPLLLSLFALPALEHFRDR